MTYEEWLEKYKPIQNHLTVEGDAPHGGCMFETFGEELNFVVEQNFDCIWTLTECDGEEYLSAGYHHVNRMGYFICDISVDPSNPPEDIRVDDEWDDFDPELEHAPQSHDFL